MPAPDGWDFRRPKNGLTHANYSPLHPFRPRRVRGVAVRAAVEPDREPERVGRVRGGRRDGAVAVVAGGGGHSGAEVLPPGRRTGEDRPGGRAGRARLAPPPGACRGRYAHSRRNRLPPGLRPPRRLLDLLGLE